MRFTDTAVLSLAGGAMLSGTQPLIARSHPTAMMARPLKEVAVGVIGTGLVGGEFLQQIEATRGMLEAQGLDVTVASISRTKPDADGERKPWMLCDSEEGCTLDDVESAISDPEAGEAGDFIKMASFLKECAPHAVIVDATASEVVSDYYAQWLASGVHVVTPNKKAGSGDLVRWKACVDAMAETGAQWGEMCNACTYTHTHAPICMRTHPHAPTCSVYTPTYTHMHARTLGDETTVGAGLPILNVLRTDLIATGDKVKTIEGIFSGTLSYIFNTYEPGMAFSDVITDAKEKGFTEPDPRDDLSGTDVARKVTILARQCGIEVALEDVPVESLVPSALQDWAPAEGAVLADAFIAEMKAYDEDKAALIAKADAAGEVLRFVGVVDVEAKTARVELKAYPKTHPFAGTQCPPLTHHLYLYPPFVLVPTICIRHVHTYHLYPPLTPSI